MLRGWIVTLGLGALCAFAVVARAADEPKSKPAAASSPVQAETHEGKLAEIEHTLGSAVHEIEHDPKKQIIAPQLPLVAWTVVVFVALLFVLGKFAWKPLMAALEKREEHMEHCLLDAEKARNESERLLEEHRRQLAQAAEEVRVIFEEGRREARAAAEDILKKARDEVDALRQRAEREITTARDQALTEIWSKSAELAVQVAGKVLERNIDAAEHGRLITAALADLPPVGSLNATGASRS